MITYISRYGHHITVNRRHLAAYEHLYDDRLSLVVVITIDHFFVIDNIAAWPLSRKTLISTRFAYSRE